MQSYTDGGLIIEESRIFILNDPWPTEDVELLLIYGGSEHANLLEYLIYRSTIIETPV